MTKNGSPVVVGVSKDCHHRFSKQPCESITIIFSSPCGCGAW